MREDITDKEIEEIAEKHSNSEWEKLQFVQEAKAYRERLKEQSQRNRRSAFQRAIGIPQAGQS